MQGFLVFLALLGLVSASAISREDSIVCPEPEPNGDELPFPNKDDCSTFYVCYGGDIPSLLNCFPGLWFNPDLHVCDWPDNIPEGVCIPPVIESTEESVSTTREPETTPGISDPEPVTTPAA